MLNLDGIFKETLEKIDKELADTEIRVAGAKIGAQMFYEGIIEQVRKGQKDDTTREEEGQCDRPEAPAAETEE